MKQGSCQKFRRKFDRIRGRGSNVDIAVIPGLRPSTWTSSCRRPERAMTGTGPSTSPRGPRNAQSGAERWVPGEGLSGKVAPPQLSLVSTFLKPGFQPGCPSRSFPWNLSMSILQKECNTASLALHGVPHGGHTLSSASRRSGSAHRTDTMEQPVPVV